MIRLVVANEERTDQRKRVWRKHNCQTDAPFERVVRWGLLGGLKVSWKAAAERVILPCQPNPRPPNLHLL